MKSNPKRKFTSRYEEKYKRGIFVNEELLRARMEAGGTMPPLVSMKDISCVQVLAAGVAEEKNTGDEYEYVKVVIYSRRNP